MRAVARSRTTKSRGAFKTEVTSSVRGAAGLILSAAGANSTGADEPSAAAIVEATLLALVTTCRAANEIPVVAG